MDTATTSTSTAKVSRRAGISRFVVGYFAIAAMLLHGLDLLQILAGTVVAMVGLLVTVESLAHKGSSPLARLVPPTPPTSVSSTPAPGTAGPKAGRRAGPGYHRPRRWQAYAAAALLLGYAGGKAAFALQDRLGLPTGPVVSAAEHERYASQVMDVATMQWIAAASGVAGACLAVATVTAVGRRIPRTPMLGALVIMLLGVGAGAVTMIVDGFGGPGPGWQWYHGVAGIAAVGLLMATIRSYRGRGPGRSRGARPQRGRRG